MNLGQSLHPLAMCSPRFMYGCSDSFSWGETRTSLVVQENRSEDPQLYRESQPEAAINQAPTAAALPSSQARHRSARHVAWRVVMNWVQISANASSFDKSFFLQNRRCSGTHLYLFPVGSRFESRSGYWRGGIFFLRYSRQLGQYPLICRHMTCSSAILGLGWSPLQLCSCLLTWQLQCV